MFYALVLFNIFVAGIAQMLLKKSAQTKHENFIGEYLNVWVISGYSLMMFSLVSNVFALSRGVLLKELGTLEALGYLFVPILSYIFFREKLNLRKIFAVVLILTGVVIFFWE